MDEAVVGAAVAELADVLNCAAGDFHTLHLNITGCEFDNMHRKVLQDYYDAAGEDYDSLSELARMFGIRVMNTNGSAQRIGYQSFEAEQEVNREVAIDRCHTVLSNICDLYSAMFIFMNEINTPQCIGVANYLQGRLEYWSKECYYFNASRTPRQMQAERVVMKETIAEKINEHI